MMASWIKTNALAVLLLPACLTFQACSFHHQVHYGTQDVPTLSGGTLQGRSLVVRPFDDARDAALKAQTGGFDHPAVVTRQDDDWYVNSDDHYEPPVPTAVTAMVSEHLQATRLFRDVKVESTAPSDGLFLTGSIKRFEAYRDRELLKQGLAAQIGLLGLVMQATQDTAYEADAVLSDVTLTDTATGAIVWKGDASGHVQGAAPLESNGFAVYQHADLALKLAVQQLVDQLVAASIAPGAAAKTASTRPQMVP